ncbi:MAG: NADP-dependent isocitrate dehydrogenase, partial [Anaerolineae bacterium]|nr:NADP-dependent isocitrate dehydrogenase [Anaerolineae bacterium]
FEAIHGSAPRRAGQNLANPSGLLLGGVMMMVHIGQPEVAERVHNAWLRTIEDGIHTYDIYEEGVSTQKVGTREFAEAVVARLGQQPQKLKPVQYGRTPAFKPPVAAVHAPARKDLVGVDVFLDYKPRDPQQLGDRLQHTSDDGLKLVMITNRGVKVWPGGLPETFCTDHWRCRFMAAENGSTITHSQIIDLLRRVCEAGFEFIKTEHLYHFDGEPGYSLGQGQ